jgi:hypothetical protein
MDRKLATDISAAVLLGQADPTLAGYPLDVLRAVERVIPGRLDLDESLREGDLSLSQLCRGYLPERAIR